MGYIGATQNIGSGLLPIVGGALAGIMWFYPFITPLLAIPIGLFLFFNMESHQTNIAERAIDTRTFLRRARQKLNDKIVIELVFLTGGFIFIGFGAFITYLPLFLRDTFDTSALIIGIIVGSRTIIGVFMASRLEHLANYFSYRTLIFSSFMALAIGMVVVPFAENQWIIILSAACYGGSFGVLRPSLQYLLLEHAPEDLRSTFAAAINFGLRLAQTLSPVCAGLLMIIITYTHLYLLAAILASLMAFYSLTATSLNKK